MTNEELYDMLCREMPSDAAAEAVDSLLPVRRKGAPAHQRLSLEERIQRLEEHVAWLERERREKWMRY